MVILEILMMISLLGLCLYCSYTDIRTGLIPNRILKWTALCAIVLDGIYYGLFCPDTFWLFILNALSVNLISLFLYAVHRFAGGDFKLTFVLSLLYPSRFILSFLGTDISLWLYVPLAMLWGYFYLLSDTIGGFFTHKTQIQPTVLWNQFRRFLYSFFRSSIYILLINQIWLVLSLNGLTINLWIIRLLCLMISWYSSRLKIFNNIWLMSAVLGIDVFLCFMTGQWPFAVQPVNYLIIIFLFLSNTLIGSRVYETIPAADLKKGMILSFETSLPLQKSRIRNLPGLSSEDLRSRLSETEVESVRRWALKNPEARIQIVRKIPFAPFLSAGFLSYFLILRMVL